MIPLGIGLAWGSEHLLKRGIPSKTARGRYLSALLIVAGAPFSMPACPSGSASA
jgi:hypothetical protein